MSNKNCENVNKAVLPLLQDVYIERCDKATENVIAVVDSQFFNHTISYFDENKNEYMYLESEHLEAIKIDGLTFEVDDVFGTYSVMVGLKLQKKWESDIKSFLESNLQGEGPKYSMLFNQQDGLWDLNFTYNYLQSFQEDATIAMALQAIYELLSKLQSEVLK